MSCREQAGDPGGCVSPGCCLCFYLFVFQECASAVWSEMKGPGGSGHHLSLLRAFVTALLKFFAVSSSRAWNLTPESLDSAKRIELSPLWNGTRFLPQRYGIGAYLRYVAGSSLDKMST